MLIMVLGGDWGGPVIRPKEKRKKEVRRIEAGSFLGVPKENLLRIGGDKKKRTGGEKIDPTKHMGV